ncbi:MAG: hemolysin III family protein [Anaerolineae bacterium]
MFAKLSHYLLEPMNALTHLAGAVAAAMGTAVLLYATRHDPPRMFSMLVYGFCLTLLFTASTLLHGIKASEVNRMRLNRLDHVAIFLLIAGSYTPIAFNLFSPPWRWRVLTAVWSIVAIGSAFKLFRQQIHGFLNASIYVILGWGGVLPLMLSANLLPLLPPSGWLLLLLGGVIYTGGFVIYYRQSPDPWPGILGHHEIWHLFVLAGSLAHYLFILWYVVPYPRS